MRQGIRTVSRRLRSGLISRGQSMVEFALISTVAMMVMFDRHSVCADRPGGFGGQPGGIRARPLCCGESGSAGHQWHRHSAHGRRVAIVVVVDPHQRRRRSDYDDRFLHGNDHDHHQYAWIHRPGGNHPELQRRQQDRAAEPVFRDSVFQAHSPRPIRRCTSKREARQAVRALDRSPALPASRTAHAAQACMMSGRHQQKQREHQSHLNRVAY